jgi:hypothetical protein
MLPPPGPIPISLMVRFTSSFFLGTCSAPRPPTGGPLAKSSRATGVRVKTAGMYARGNNYRGSLQPSRRERLGY